MVAPTPPPRKPPAPSSRWTATEPPAAEIDPRPALAAAARHAQQQAERRRVRIRRTGVVVTLLLLPLVTLGGAKFGTWLKGSDPPSTPATAAADTEPEIAEPAAVEAPAVYATVDVEALELGEGGILFFPGRFTYDTPAEAVRRVSISMGLFGYLLKDHEGSLPLQEWGPLACLGVDSLHAPAEAETEGKIVWLLNDGETVGPPTVHCWLARYDPPLEPGLQYWDCYWDVWNRHTRGCLPVATVDAGGEVLLECSREYTQLINPNRPTGNDWSSEHVTTSAGWQVTGRIEVDQATNWCRTSISAEWLGE